MSAHALLDEARRRGVDLIAEGEHVRVRGRRGTLTPELLDAIRRNKAEVLALLRRPPIVTLPELGRDEAAAVWLEYPSWSKCIWTTGSLAKHSQDLGECPACGRSRWWRSVHGAIVCALCHPPAAPGLVVEWIVASIGGGFDA